MTKKRGRKSKYETDVKSHFTQIKEWLENGATERQVAENLGIGYSTFNRYKGEKEELRELIKKSRQSVVLKLRGALIKKALGFEYQEAKIVDGVKTEINIKYALPDVAAINLALKNYDKENWANDPQMLDLRKQELKLREKQIEENSW